MDQVQNYVDKFGAQPAHRSVLGKQIRAAVTNEPSGPVARLVEGLSRINASTERTAIGFLNLKAGGKCITDTALKQWAANLKSRATLRYSELSRALDASVQGNVRAAHIRNFHVKHKSLTAKGPKSHGKSSTATGSKSLTATGSKSSTSTSIAVSEPEPVLDIDTDGAVPVVRSVVPYAPPSVVNWIFQALLDVVSTLERLLGDGSFDRTGHWDGGGGCGEVMLFWGSHLGAVRGQAMIAWDYDGDLAVFMKSGVSFEGIWQLSVGPLERLGYRCSKHSDFKYRISPPNPMCWAPYKELFQEIREHDRTLSRADILKRCAALWRDGARSTHPHGSNCIDIEVYTVGQPLATRRRGQPSDSITIRGTNKIVIGISSLFPSTTGIFGPLSFRMPRTTEVLLKEYGPTCVTEARVKTFTRGGVAKLSSHKVPPGTRLHVWPYVQLYRVDPKYYS